MNGTVISRRTDDRSVHNLGGRGLRRHCACGLALLCLLAGSGTMHAQKGLDSLARLSKDPSQPDSVRFQATKDLIWKGTLFSKPDTGLILAGQLFKDAEEHNNEQYMAAAMDMLGIANYLTGNQAEALNYYERCYTIQKERADTMGMSNVLSHMAMVHKDRGELAKAMEYCTRVLKFKEAQHLEGGIMDIINQIASIYEAQGDEVRALDHYQRSLAMAEKLGNEGSQAVALQNIGSLLISQKKYAEALQYAERALPIDERRKDDRGLGYVYLTKGIGLKGLGRLDEALEYEMKSLSLREVAHDDRGTARCLNNICEIHIEKGDFAMGIPVGTRALSLSQRVGEVAGIQNASRSLWIAYKAIGRPKEALAMYELSTEMSDSLRNEDNKRGVMEQQFQYEYEKKEALLTAEQEKKDAVAVEELRRKNVQRNAFIGGFGLMILLAGVFFFQRNRISREKKRSEELLLNILPEEVAEELKDTGAAQAKHFDNATILFTDFKGFTQASETMSPQELVAELNTCFKAFDHIITSHGIEKIKTIGDAYMCAGGLPDPKSSSPSDVVFAALEMQVFMKTRKVECDAQSKPAFEMRLGIHTGPVVAGIVGVKKFQYDIWGDTVNTASRMESSGEVGQVNISEATHALVKNETDLTFTPRGKVQAKGKGEMEMYFVGRA